MRKAVRHKPSYHHAGRKNTSRPLRYFSARSKRKDESVFLPPIFLRCFLRGENRGFDFILIQRFQSARHRTEDAFADCAPVDGRDGSEPAERACDERLIRAVDVKEGKVLLQAGDFVVLAHFDDFGTSDAVHAVLTRGCPHFLTFDHEEIGRIAYKYVLHHPKNTIDKWFLECIGVYVSLLNECHYCVDHHFSGMVRLIGNNEKSDGIKAELISRVHSLLDSKQQSALDYVKLLTLTPGKVEIDSIQCMRNNDWSDGEILEINQVAAYFNYANRTVLGLGINTEGDDIGLSPNNSDDLNDWNHS